MFLFFPFTSTAHAHPCIPVLSSSDSRTKIYVLFCQFNSIQFNSYRFVSGQGKLRYKLPETNKRPSSSGHIISYHSFVVSTFVLIGIVVTVISVASHPSASGVAVHAAPLDSVWLDNGRDGEFDRSGVDDSDDVSDSGRLNDGKEGMLDSVFGVDLDDLLVVVRTLEELEACVEGTSVRAQQDGDGGDRGGEGDGVDGTSLHDLGDVLSNVAGDVFEGFVVGFDGGLDGVLEGLRVADRHRVGVEAGGGNHGRKGAKVTVFEVHGHLVGGGVGPVP